MPELELAHQLAQERSAAVRVLLARPLLHAEASPAEFRSVARHAPWLTDYFEQTCGWVLTVDPAAGFARLGKRAVTPGADRPLRRTRGGGAPFDRRRYQLLFAICAELVRHPVTTVGLLAGAITAESTLDTSRRGDRSALVDAIRTLASWGALRVTGGDVDAFLSHERANALLTADTTLLHRLVVSAAAPSTLPVGGETDDVVARLAAEPRYADSVSVDDGDGSAEGTDEGRNRWARHRLGRRVLDDPVVYIDDLTAAERAYWASSSGRRWLRDRVAEAGLELEERSEGMLAVDPERVATDRDFPAPAGNVYQLALILADRVTAAGWDGRRRLGRLTPAELRADVERVLSDFPGWARGYRDDAEGSDRLAREAVELLVSFGLARIEADGAVQARPAMARYRVGAPIHAETGSLFADDAFADSAGEGL